MIFMLYSITFWTSHRNFQLFGGHFKNFLKIKKKSQLLHWPHYNKMRTLKFELKTLLVIDETDTR